MPHDRGGVGLIVYKAVLGQPVGTVGGGVRVLALLNQLVAQLLAGATDGS